MLKRKTNQEQQCFSCGWHSEEEEEWQSVSCQLNHDVCSTTLALTSALYFLPYWSLAAWCDVSGKKDGWTTYPITVAVWTFRYPELHQWCASLLDADLETYTHTSQHRDMFSSHAKKSAAAEWKTGCFWTKTIPPVLQNLPPFCQVDLWNQAKEAWNVLNFI